MKKLLCIGAFMALASCNREHQAGLMLRVSSELSTPADIDSVRIQIVHATRGEVARTDIVMSAAPTERFPFTFSIGPSQTSKEGPYTFRLIGMLKGRPRTVREAITDVPRADMRTLSMAVEFLCYDKVKLLENGDAVGLCPAGQTCIAGECKPIPTYRPEELPIYVATPTAPTDTGTDCYDAPQCFAAPILLFPDMASCRVARPAGPNLTIALLLPADSPGIPYQGRKLVAFDSDGVAGWREAGAEVQLPTGICTILKQFPGSATLVASAAWLNKSTAVALCAVPTSNADAAVTPSSDTGTEAAIDATIDAITDTTMVTDVSSISDANDAHETQPDVERPELGTTTADVGLEVALPGQCEAIGGGFLEAGTSCDAGVCNGTGQCGQCVPGENRCNGKTRQTCTPAGNWSAGTDCLSICTDGECRGVCTPGVDKQCRTDNKTLQTCDATGTYVDSETCQFVCSIKACTGVCRPGDADCLGNTSRFCNSDGQWVNKTVCPYLCNAGTCTGICTPGDRQCSGSTPQVCTSGAAWQAESPCSFACSGKGVCEPDNVLCWGQNTDGKATPKSGSFTSVSAGSGHACGVRVNGTVACWGNNSDGQSTPPAGTFSSVSAGENVTCGIRTDGTAACWGKAGGGLATPPTGTFSSVSISTTHACGVRANGTVACWGNNSNGQSTPPAGTFSSVSAGDMFTCGLRQDGTIACWGEGSFRRDIPPAGQFIAVSASQLDSLAVRTDGTIAGWGYNPPYGFSGTYTTVSDGISHACGLRADGTASCWGDNYHQQATAKPGAFSSISAGENFTCATLRP